MSEQGARDRIAVWLDDDQELRIPDTPWGRALYADLREVLDAGSHDEWACKGNQRLYREAVADRDRLAATVASLRAALTDLADDFESEVDWSNGRSDYGDNAAWEQAARRVRALADPAPDRPDDHHDQEATDG